MLKITTKDDGDQRTLVVEGKLVDPWVSELEKSWTEAQRMVEQGKVRIDLKDVTAISQHGENLLFEMMREGAMFNCCRGVLTRHVVKQLQRRRQAQAGGDRRES
jgi:ABC-type transporter Mla MlaB component